MNRLSARAKSRLLTVCYALCLVLTYVLGTSDYFHSLNSVNVAAVIVVPLILTILLWRGQTHIARREAGTGRRPRRSYWWAPLLAVYLFLTWGAIEISTISHPLILRL